MSKVAVVYWSGTGNTEVMAHKVVEGAQKAGADVSLFFATEFNSEMMDKFDSVAFGCPSMGAEVLEESEFAPMFRACESQLKDKKIALFGSYGWGDGEWMRDWEADCRHLGAKLVCDSVICNETPDSDGEAACLDLGRAIA